jgi:localization factor PodJL
VEGVKWYRKAAESGNAKASFNLALALKDGDGVAIDLVESFKWFKVAAEGGMLRRSGI